MSTSVVEFFPLKIRSLIANTHTHTSTSDCPVNGVIVERGGAAPVAFDIYLSARCAEVTSTRVILSAPLDAKSTPTGLSLTNTLLQIATYCARLCNVYTLNTLLYTAAHLFRGATRRNALKSSTAAAAWKTQRQRGPQDDLVPTENPATVRAQPGGQLTCRPSVACP